MLSFVAALATALMARKHRVERAAFMAKRTVDRLNLRLSGSLARLVRAQAELVNAEKLAVLGQLVAGVAHEVNTPLGAINASADTLNRSIPVCTQTLPEALLEMDEVQRHGFRALLDAASQRGTSALSSREERALRRALAETLTQAQIPLASQRAVLLAELGLTGDPAPFLPLLRHPGAQDVLDHVDRLVSMQRSVDTIQIAAARASRIIQALKRYAHPGDANGAAVQESLSENLETVLTLYASQTRRQIKVVREYLDPGVIEGQHEALNQVWTNLVQNALQSMGSGGCLTVRVEALDLDSVRVQVGDDGPGIPESVRPRLFEPFYTTRAVGEGSGLGLSICQDIVEQHGGRIEVESQPGATRFSVVLPRSAP